MSPSQNDSGRAFEYGLVVAMQSIIGESKIEESETLKRAKESYERIDEVEKDHIRQASAAAVTFLISREPFFLHRDLLIMLQPDQQGEIGDVRDLVLTSQSLGTSLGISAKNRHAAVKHSRLSQRIDFGEKWFGMPCSNGYFDQIQPIFDELRLIKRQNQEWEDLDGVHLRFYEPILDAFISEINRMVSIDSTKVASGLIKYLVGEYDFYKVIKENGTVTIDSYNLNGSLGWGKKERLPIRVIEAVRNEGSSNKVTITLESGWAFSFRIHSAKKKVEPSLKFDIQLISYPRGIQHHSIDYLQ